MLSSAPGTSLSTPRHPHPVLSCPLFQSLTSNVLTPAPRPRQALSFFSQSFNPLPCHGFSLNRALFHPHHKYPRSPSPLLPLQTHHPRPTPPAIHLPWSYTGAVKHCWEKSPATLQIGTRINAGFLTSANGPHDAI